MPRIQPIDEPNTTPDSPRQDKTAPEIADAACPDPSTAIHRQKAHTMTRKTLIVAATLAFAGATAFAQEATSDDWMAIPAVKSRAEVRAELAQARKDGTIRAWSAGYIESVKAPKTRAEVVSATLAARDSGELAAINGEVYRFSRVPAVRLAGSGR